jgi:hypothetical protein
MRWRNWRRNLVIKCHKAKFDGNLLKRGFWIYICVIAQNGKEALYVGRTGDSSSPYAASPFLRLTGHLNRKSTAKSAAMLNQLTKHGFDVEQCSFQLYAFGPLFPEQLLFEQHKPYRDILAGLEKGFAKKLHDRGYIVIGTHNSKIECDTELLSQVINHADFIWKPRA